MNPSDKEPEKKDKPHATREQYYPHSAQGAPSSTVRPPTFGLLKDRMHRSEDFVVVINGDLIRDRIPNTSLPWYFPSPPLTRPRIITCHLESSCGTLLICLVPISPRCFMPVQNLTAPTWSSKFVRAVLPPPLNLYRLTSKLSIARTHPATPLAPSQGKRIPPPAPY